MNAKQEFLRATLGLTIKCASLSGESHYFEETDKYESKEYILKMNYSNEDFKSFLNSLDFNYDSGYGGQQLFGIVWLANNEWLERGEYDGSEWWEHKYCPTIPEELL